MSVTVKRGKWLVGIYKNASGKFEPIFTDNQEAALEFDNLNAAIKNIRKLTDFSFDEFAFYENGKLTEVK